MPRRVREHPRGVADDTSLKEITDMDEPTKTRHQKKQAREEHGLANSPEYAVWSAMIARCENLERWNYHRYGGRGIRVCERWRESFAAFYADMGPRPVGHTIERRDNNGNYEPSNCFWATKQRQANNRRSNVIVVIDGESHTIAEWGRIRGVSHQYISWRLKQGWPIEEALSPKLRRPRHGLTSEQIAEIREAVAAGISMKAVARMYKTTFYTVSKLLKD